MRENDPALGREGDRATEAGTVPASDAEVSGRRTSGPRSLVVSLLCLQSGLFLTFAVGGLGTPAYISFHLGLCAMTVAVGLWFVRSSPAVEDANGKIAIILQLAVWTALAGPFGTLMAAAMTVPQDSTGADGKATAAPEAASELTRLELLHGFLLDRRLRLEHAHRIRPMLDVILDGTQTEKLDALSLISKRYAPALAPALKRALEDRDGSVRVLAATVMAQQHNAYTKRIGALQAIAKASPDCPDHWGELGQAHLDYAGSGLLETSRADAEVTQAQADLARAKLPR